MESILRPFVMKHEASAKICDILFHSALQICSSATALSTTWLRASESGRKMLYLPILLEDGHKS
jgi:hypothetical protein